MLKRTITTLLLGAVTLNAGVYPASAETKLTVKGCQDTNLERHFDVDLEQIPGIINHIAGHIERVYQDYHLAAVEYHRQHGSTSMTEADKTAAANTWDQLTPEHPLKQNVSWLRQYAKNWNTQGKPAAQSNLASLPYWVTDQRLSAIQSTWSGNDPAYQTVRNLVYMLVMRKASYQDDLYVMMIWALGGTHDDLLKVYRGESPTAFPSKAVFNEAWTPEKSRKLSEEEFWLWEQTIQLGVSYYAMAETGPMLDAFMEQNDCQSTPRPSAWPPPATVFKPKNQAHMSAFSSLFPIGFSS